MNNPEDTLITFVLPCYKVEKFVQMCLDSIYDTNLPENRFEVLCINDCSPDNTQQILELNQRVHSNIRIVKHVQNKGLGGARNTGIKEAKGKYLWFVDSDDAITAPRLMELLQEAEKKRLDLFCFNHRRIDEGGKVLSTELFFRNIEELDGFSFAESAFGHLGIIYYMMFVWRFIYRTDYIRSLNFFFPEKVAWEEPVFVSKTILNAKRIASYADVMYSYRSNQTSTTGSFWRSYPAKLIYDHTFPLGSSLLLFSEEIKEESLRKAYRDWAINNYINGFPVFLFRTSKAERKKFYLMVKEQGKGTNEAVKGLTFLSKLLLNPIIGPSLAAIGARCYKWTH